MSTLPKIGEKDPRYEVLNRRGFNKRFTGKPEYFKLAETVEDVVAAVQEAVTEGKRLSVRSGGHCLEGFVADPSVQVLLDMSLMTGVYFDEEKKAFCIEAGTLLGEVYRKLFLGWGVLIPAGESPLIGAGGHFQGGCFGFLCREHGLAADYLYGAELVVVDENKKAHTVVATREPNDPNHELWWALTGAGGGNYGIVTKFWFRTPGVNSDNPADLLPKAPASVHLFRANWNWEGADKAAFSRLVKNYCDWCEQNSKAGTPEATLYSLLMLRRLQTGSFGMIGLCTAGPAAADISRKHVEAVNEGTGLQFTYETEELSWPAFACNPFPELFGVGMDNARMQGKDAFFRKGLTAEQINAVYKHLTTTEYNIMGAMFGMVTYGGKVNTIAPDATATPQRDCIISSACSAGWGSKEEEAAHIAWNRSLYRELFAATGGVPVPNEQTDGAMINHPDTDLADPALNTSGLHYSAFYWKENYPRLQKAKMRWDPLNIFRHALSIEPVK